MKIAILTQPLIANYGGILQNFALQKVLNNEGGVCETINLIKPSVISKMKSSLYSLLRDLGVKRYMNFRTEKEIAYSATNQTNFIQRHIKLSPKIFGDDKLKEYFKHQKFDVCIVGSDQVWRPKYSPDLYNYFLNFVPENITKIAYSASFGTDNWEFNEEQTLKCKEFVKDFKSISVRESQAVQLCKEKFSVEANHTLDPVLLLGKERYVELINQSDTKIEKNYIFAYLLDFNQQQRNDIENFARKKGLKVIFIDCSAKLKNQKLISVEQWLSYISNANLVITDSFHGSIFSILFNREFISLGNKERGQSRFESVLNLFDLRDRLTLELNYQRIEMLFQNKINYSKVELKLVELRENSRGFITRSIS